VVIDLIASTKTSKGLIYISYFSVAISAVPSCKVSISFLFGYNKKCSLFSFAKCPFLHGKKYNSTKIRTVGIKLVFFFLSWLFPSIFAPQFMRLIKKSLENLISVVVVSPTP
jgi:hypothetical protein